MHVDVAQLETHRAALTGHCYRMLGSAFDADDAVQETMVRAWRSLDRFDGRASLRTWMYRIATNVCLDALSSRSRRARPMEERPDGTVDEELETRPRTHWLDPIPDARALPSDADPLELVTLRQSIRLAFVAALQHLPARQRAALLLTEVRQSENDGCLREVQESCPPKRRGRGREIEGRRGHRRRQNEHASIGHGHDGPRELFRPGAQPWNDDWHPPKTTGDVAGARL